VNRGRSQNDHPVSCGPGSNGSGQGPSVLLFHLARALSRYVQELRHTGSPVPPELEELASFLVLFVRSRQDTTEKDSSTTIYRWLETVAPGFPGATHDADVAGRLLVTKREAADRLGVSERTVDRLVASGRLPLVHVERAARLRVTDLEAYVRGLAEGRPTRSDTGRSQ
jgi:excisionase family DNA binding protein